MAMDSRVPDLSEDELDRYPVGVITLDRHGVVVHYNRAESAFSRLKPHDVIGRQYFGDIAPCAAVKDFQGRFERFAAEPGDATERFDFAFDFAWGRQDVTITMIRRDGRDEINLLIKVRSSRRSRRAVARMTPAEADALPVAPVLGQWVEDDAAWTTWWSPQLRTIFGLAAGTSAQRGRLDAAVVAEDRSRVDDARRACAGEAAPLTVQYRITRPDGSVRAVVEHVATLDDRGARRRFGTVLDITDRVDEMHELKRSALHDTLTGLPNRALLLKRLDIAFASGGHFALLFLDLDRFKNVNDTAGHLVGDALLRLVASRLASCVRAGDTVARLNGDEFVVLLRGADDIGEVATVADAILDTIAKPFVIDEEHHFVTVSIGVALAPHDGATVDELLRAADFAMYRSKELGANAWLRYDEEMRAQASQATLLEIALRRGIDRGEFDVYYQPIVDAASGAVVKAEALVRWRNPEREAIVAPAEFIPLAERTGLIVPLGTFVLDRVCAQVRAWDDAGLPPVTVAVNISPLQFKDRRFPETVRETLLRHAIAPSRIELELTESLMERFEDTMESLLDLKLLGVRLSIDDFGTGYSALAYLKYFPIDTLKLDRAFVSGIGNHPLDIAIANTIVRLATDLKLTCVAEGVETAEQRDALCGIGATQLQGYLFSRPVDPAAFTAILRQASPGLVGTFG